MLRTCGFLLPGRITDGETPLKRRRGPYGKYLDDSRRSVSDVSTVLWRSIDSFITLDDFRRRIMYFQTSTRPNDSVSENFGIMIFMVLASLLVSLQNVRH